MWLWNNEQKKEQTYLVCLQAVEKYKKVESINTQSDYEKTSKKCTDKKKMNLFCVFFKSDEIPRKQVQDHSKEFLGNNIINEKDFLEKPLVAMIITW